jgi:hypothetical protein
MLWLHWYRIIALFLWIAPHVLLGVVAALIYRRRLYREFPGFFAYVLYTIVVFVLLFAMHCIPSVTKEQYSYAYYATLMPSVALRFGVIGEISKFLVHESPFLQVAARRSLQCVTMLLLGLSVLLAIYIPDNNKHWITGASVVNRGAAMTQAGLLVSLLLFSSFLGLSWRRPAFGITLGLGVLTSVDLALSAVRAAFPSDSPVTYLDLLRTTTYLVCVLVWIGYLLAPEHEPASLKVVSRDQLENLEHGASALAKALEQG